MTETIETVSDLLRVVDFKEQFDAGAAASPPWFKDRANLWYRGHSRRDWLLQPQVLRDEFERRARALNPVAPDPVFSFEASLFNQLRRRGHHFLSAAGALTNAYFLAQHHGLPTRLLDWSTNPLVGLFFAVSDDSSLSGSVFVMRARYAIHGQEERDILYQEDPEVEAFLRSFIDRDFGPQTVPGLPFRIIPDLHHGRMLQQDARFTLHQPGCQDLHEVQSPSFIRKLEIPADAKSKIQEELRFLGVHWGTLFPDLPHLVKQIRHEAQV